MSELLYNETPESYDPDNLLGLGKKNKAFRQQKRANRQARKRLRQQQKQVKRMARIANKNAPDQAVEELNDPEQNNQMTEYIESRGETPVSNNAAEMATQAYGLRSDQIRQRVEASPETTFQDAHDEILEEEMQEFFGDGFDADEKSDAFARTFANIGIAGRHGAKLLKRHYQTVQPEIYGFDPDTFEDPAHYDQYDDYDDYDGEGDNFLTLMSGKRNSGIDSEDYNGENPDEFLSLLSGVGGMFKGVKDKIEAARAKKGKGVFWKRKGAKKVINAVKQNTNPQGELNVRAAASQILTPTSPRSSTLGDIAGEALKAIKGSEKQQFMQKYGLWIIIGIVVIVGVAMYAGKKSS